jgi:hypothetical protein
MKIPSEWNRKLPYIGIAAAVLGSAAMAFGIHRGEMAVVFAKAVKICMECIGIG